MLAAMFDPNPNYRLRPHAMKYDQGNVFIDRDPEPFRIILSFLRSARLPKDIVGCSLEQVEWEADYYGLKELLKIIGERKTAKGKKKEEERPKMSSSDKVREEEPKTSSLEFAQKALEMRKK